MARRKNQKSRTKDKVRKKCGHFRCTNSGPTNEPTEFVGNVKIVLIDPPLWQYRQIAWTTSLITFAYFAMGACVFYTMLFGVLYAKKERLNLHIFLFTLSFEVFLMMSFLTINKLNINSVYLPPVERRMLSKIYLYLFYIFTYIAMIALFFDHGFKFKNRHAYYGWAAFSFLNLHILSKYWKKLKNYPYIEPASLYAVVLNATISYCEFFQFKKMRWFTGFGHSADILTTLCVYYTIVCIYKSLKLYIDPEIEEMPAPKIIDDDNIVCDKTCWVDDEEIADKARYKAYEEQVIAAHREKELQDQLYHARVRAAEAQEPAGSQHNEDQLQETGKRRKSSKPNGNQQRRLCPPTCIDER